MNRSPDWKKPLGLAVILCVLAGVTYWVEFKNKPEEERKIEASKKAFDLTGIATARIEIEKETKKIVLSCLDIPTGCKPGDNSKWELLEPIHYNADDSNVNSLYSALNNMSATSIIDLSSETPEKRVGLLKQYKLDPDSRALYTTLKVRVNTTKDGTHTAYFGDRYPVGDGIFVGLENAGKFDDSRILVLPTSVLSNFENPAPHWRDKTILTLKQNSVDRIELRGGKQSGSLLQLERNPDSWDIVTSSEKLTADLDGVNALLSAAVFLKAKGFAAEAKDSAEARKILSGTKSVLKLTLTTKEKSQTLSFFEKTFRDGKNTATQLYATVSDLDPVYEIETDALGRLDRSAKILRQSKLISSTERMAIRWIRAEDRFGTWLIDANSKTKKKSDAFLDRISTSVITDFTNSVIPPAKTGTVIRFGQDEGKPLEEFHFWQANGKLYAKDLKSKKKETLILSQDVASTIPWNSAGWNKQDGHDH